MNTNETFENLTKVEYQYDPFNFIKTEINDITTVYGEGKMPLK